MMKAKQLSMLLDPLYAEINSLKEKIKAQEKKISNLEATLQNSLTWTVDDFAYRASMLEERYEENNKVYNPDTFEDALNTMIRKHDAEVGISWDTIDFWLDEMCRYE